MNFINPLRHYYFDDYIAMYKIMTKINVKINVKGYIITFIKKCSCTYVTLFIESHHNRKIESH